MASKSREVREEQKAHWEDRLGERLAFLKDKGVEQAQIAKDAAVRKLRAEIRKADARLRAIESLEKKAEEMRQQKQEKLAAPRQEKAKKRKTAAEAEEPPEMSKRQKKKQKKREKKQKSEG